MSTDDQLPREEASPPTAARAALRRRGERLLSELESMRQAEGERLAIQPLDPQAQLALRRRGDELLAQLADERSELLAGPRGTRHRWSWRRRIGLAAALAALAIAAIQITIPQQPEPPVAPTATAQLDAPGHGASEVDGWSVSPISGPITTGPITSPAIPEPSSALLALLGGVILLGRRRRP